MFANPAKVTLAPGDKNRSLLQSPYGAEVEPERAPEAISKAVASLPPEQMFELMKQMKVRPPTTRVCTGRCSRAFQRRTNDPGRHIPFADKFLDCGECPHLVVSTIVVTFID